MGVIRFIANVLWVVLGGWWTALVWIFIGVVLCITIIGIPIGKQCFKMSALTFAPFGKLINSNFGAYPVGNAIWMIFVGLWMAIGYFVIGAILCIIIVGIPAGLQSFKMSKLAIAPFGANVEVIR